MLNLVASLYEDALRIAADAGIRLAGAEITYPAGREGIPGGPLRVIAQREESGGLFLILAHELLKGKGGG